MTRKPILLILSLFTLLAFSQSTDWHFPEKYEGPQVITTDLSWHPDILEGYEARYVNHGIVFDGPCRSTIIRKLSPKPNGKAYLYVHGFNDYFFQKEMGELFVDSGYSFYAVDLRRYGRSWQPWQYPFNVRKQKEYFEDIDSAIAQMRRDGMTDITLSGHSTGGLTVLYMAAEKGLDLDVERIVTDSPFLEWNFSPFMRNVGAPLIEFLSKFSKNAKIKQSHCDGYAFSILKQYHGEWEYDTDWKMIYSPPVTYSWVGSINHAQSVLMKKGKNITIPVLVMHSSRKIDGCNWTPEFQTGDAVLDPAMIQKRGEKLGLTREVCTIDSGLHDLILSRKDIREAAYDTIFSFIRRH